MSGGEVMQAIHLFRECERRIGEHKKITKKKQTGMKKKLSDKIKRLMNGSRTLRHAYHDFK